ncbi:MAG: hypothetical protein ACI8PZ_001846 [Myxococcota bacterium]
MRFVMSVTPTEPSPDLPAGFQRLDDDRPRAFVWGAALVGWSVATLVATQVSQATLLAQISAPAILAAVLVVPVHEAVHLLAHPGAGLSERSVVLLAPRQARLASTYNGTLSRERRIAIALAPGIALTALLASVALAGWTWLGLAIVANASASLGDLWTAVSIGRRVPAGATLHQHEGEVWWGAAAG